MGFLMIYDKSVFGYVRVKGQIGSYTLNWSSFFAGRDPSIFLKFGLNVFWSYLSMWLKYCVGLSMGLGFSGHYNIISVTNCIVRTL